VIGGLLLALVSAALVNLGFLVQHRALAGIPTAATGARRLRRAIADPTWLSGQALGWLGFGLQIVAVAIAPLSLVQAFAAGGLALSVPLAAGIFRYPVTRAQTAAVLAIAAGLAVLTIGFSTTSDRLSDGRLITVMAIGAGAGAALGRHRSVAARAAAAGIFYGLADAAIKAVSLEWHAHGAAGLLDGWAPVAAAGTFAGFVCFQAALADGAPVPAISVMTGAAALVALACGLGAFGESLGADLSTRLVHGLSIALVLAGVPALAAAQTTIAHSADRRRERARSRARPLPVVGPPR
jgi:hypothetical protein